ncbi:MAG: hypothetical protein KatS3mg059_1243 [Thermomicrobiales bacterium]|nr:MAG: hypothetical protein KatS3mg059_1243 [Thermomicrobiales bacterium]
MSWERWLLAILVLGLAAAQYGLIVMALRDLLRRPSVRGNNKVAWGLIIITIPFLGPLVYSYMGPTSFLPRHQAVRRRLRFVPRRNRKAGKH